MSIPTPLIISNVNINLLDTHRTILSEIDRSKLKKHEAGALDGIQAMLNSYFDGESVNIVKNIQKAH